MKKSIFTKVIAMGLLFMASAVNAQIRSYVGVVREQFYPDMVKFLEEYRDELKNSGYSNYSKYIDSYLKGGFGSGFVYVAEDGTNFIVTNRHVVSQAVSASIEFENPETGAISKYENLSVFATDDDIDIALLKFADGKNPFKKGLTFSKDKLSDGADVWSAGFPGLGADPVWQLGKGTVTNSSARIKEMLDPSISTVIQHSAEIDGGNSGGPLMTASKTGTAGYEVIGVNTWKAVYRQNTNYAIPAKVIADFITASLKTKDDGEVSKSRAEKFAKTINDKSADFTSVVKYVSYESASKIGKKNFISAIKFAPTEVRNTVISAFANSPVEGLRYAVAYQYWKKFSAKENENGALAVESSEKKAESYSYSFKKDDGSKVNSEWINEHGLWRLNSLLNDGEKAEKQEKVAKNTGTKKGSKTGSKSENKGFTLSNDLEVLLEGGALVSLSGEKPGYFGNLTLWITESSGYTLTAGYQETDFGHLVVFGPGIKLQLPCQYKNWNFNPFGAAGIRGGAGSDKIDIGYELEGGIQFIYNGDGFNCGISVGYVYQKLGQFMDTTLEDEETESGNFENSGIKVSVITGF